MRLLRVELRRFFSRRAVVIMLLLGMLGVFGTAAGILYNTRPISSADLQTAETMADRDNQDPGVIKRMERCVERRGDEQACSDRFESQAEWYVYRDQLDLAAHDEWVLGMAGIAAALMLLAGATFIGGDFNSGSLSNQLLFRPRRRDAWLAKSVVVGAVGAAYGVLTIGIANLTIWAFAKRWDRPIGPNVEHYLAMASIRAIMIVAALGVAGFAVGLLTRHTAAVLGVVAFYAIAAETLARIVWHGSEKWLLSNHVRAFIAGDWQYGDYTHCSDATGAEICVPGIIRFTTEYAAGYLGTITAVVALVSLLVFRTRDVA